MLKRLLYAILALGMAWYLGPFLTVVLSFLPVAAIAGALVPENLTEQDPGFYAIVAIWALIFFFAMKAFGLPLGYFWPNFSRYSVTKAMRRLQGHLGELLLVAAFVAAPLAAYHQLTFSPKDYGLSKVSEADILEPLPRYDPSRMPKDEETQAALRKIAKNFLFVQHGGYMDMLPPHQSRMLDEIIQSDPKHPSKHLLRRLFVKSSITPEPDERLPLAFAKSFPEFDQIAITKLAHHYEAEARAVIGGSTAQIASMMQKSITKEARLGNIPQAKHNTSLSFSATPSLLNSPLSEHYPIPEKLNSIAETLSPIQGHILSAAMQRVEEEKERLLKASRGMEIELLKLHHKRLKQVEARNQILASKFAEAYALEFNSQHKSIRFIEGIAYSFSKVGGWLILYAFVLLVVVHQFLRSKIASFYAAILRFVDESQLGRGGSSRFAGGIEEWEMLLNKRAPGATFGMFPGLGHIMGLILSSIEKGVGKSAAQKFIRDTMGIKPDLSESALFVGRSLYNPFLNVGLRDDRHMITIAGSRSGKGTCAIIPNLLLWEGSALVVDPKGTNAAVTARRRREMGQDVHLIDPFGIVEKDEAKRAAFNPLENLDPESDTIRETISTIVEALVVSNPNAKDPHWDEGAKTILTGMIGHLISSPQYAGKADLTLIRDLLAMSEEEQTALWAEMSFNTSAGNTAKEAASRIIRGIGTDEMLSIFSNADKHTEWLASPAMQKTLSHSTFSFADLKEKPTTIYLILPPHFLETHNRFLRLFINLTISQMSMGGRSKIPVLTILDEFLALGYMSEVEKAFGLMAGYNIILWPFIQDMGRLRDIYKNSVNSFITNSRAVQVFGISDEESTKFVSTQIGQRGVKARKETNANFPLRTPSEVALDVETGSNRQYILRAGKAPLLLEKVKYYKAKLLNGTYPSLFDWKFDPDPDYKS